MTKILFDVVVPFEMKMPEEELKARIQDSVSRTMENCAALINVIIPMFRQEFPLYGYYG